MPGLNQGERSSNYEDKSNKNKKPNGIKGVFKAGALATGILAAGAGGAGEKGENYDTSTNNSEEVSSLLSKTKEGTKKLFKQIFLVGEASAGENPQIKLGDLEVKEGINKFEPILSSLNYLNISEKKKEELIKVLNKALTDDKFDEERVLDTTKFIQIRVVNEGGIIKIIPQKFKFDENIRFSLTEEKTTYEVNKKDTKNPLIINTGGITYKGDKDGNIFEIGVGGGSSGAYTKLGGAFPISQKVALAAIGQFGEEELRGVIAAGLQLTKTGTLMMSGSYAEKDGEYKVQTSSGGKENVEFTPHQWKLRLKYEQKIKSDIIKSLRAYDIEINTSKSSNKKFEPETIDYNENFYKIINRGVEGAQVVGAKVGATFELKKGVFANIKLVGDYIHWNVTGDKEFSGGIEGSLLLQDLIKEKDSLMLKVKATDFEQRVGAGYSYPLGEGWNAYVDATIGKTEHNEKTDIRAMAGLRYEGNFDKKYVAKVEEKQRIRNPLSSGLTSRLYNFADESMADKILAKGYYEEKMKEKPQAPQEPETQDQEPKKKNPEVGNKAPIAKITVDKTNIKSGEEIKLDGSKSKDPDGKITEYIWRNSTGTVIGTGINLSIKLTNSETITLQVKDNKRKLSNIDQVKITVDGVSPPNPEIDNPPTATIKGVLEVEKGGTTTLTCEGKDPEGKTLTYLWSTGATTPSITVGVGTYKCKVSDGKNTVEVSATVKEKGTIEPIDTTPPSKIGESFNFEFKYSTFEGTMTFDEDIASISGVGISGNDGNITASFSGKTVSFSGTAPGDVDSAIVTVTVEDKAGNPRTVSSKPYQIM